MDTIKNVHFYYVRRDNGQPMATVCFARGVGSDEKYTWSRGIAICSDKDRFDKKRGKAVAIARVRRANGTWKKSMLLAEPLPGKGECNQIAIEFIKLANNYGLTNAKYKSEFNVELTPFEKHMLEDEEV